MRKIPFNVDAYTARLIGRENVSKLNGAVIELVKNTYDADASLCILYYEHETETLYILDNGCGMDENIIIQHWMTIGRSTKKNQYTSKGGRVQTGAKGIGRFALDRIANSCEMFTASDKGNLIWKVNWEDFDLKDNITDVTAELYDPSVSVENFISDILNTEVRKLFLSKLISTATVFKLMSLSDDWDDHLLKKIKDDLMTLIPYERKNEFQVYVFGSKTNLSEAEVLSNDDSFAYDYKIFFDVTEEGKVRIDMHRNEFDFGEKFNEIMEDAGFCEEDRKYFKGAHILEEVDFSMFLPSRNETILNTIGSFSGVFYFEKQGRTKQDEETYYYKPEVKKSINNDIFGGIRIYRDDFRVRPYGEPRTSAADWLLLASRNRKSPAAPSHKTGAWRVAANQISGSIFISRLNTTLPDQANREGIVETKEFTLFKEFVINVIQFFERDRQYVFRKLKGLEEKKNEVIIIQQEIEMKAQQANAERMVRKDESRKEESAPSNVVATESHLFIDAKRAKVALDYKDSRIYWDFLREDFNCICGYCGKCDTIVVSRGFEIDHFVPKKIDEDRINDYTNLVYSCFTCNRKKHVKWPTEDKSKNNDGVLGFIDPISEEYDKHLSRDENGNIIPLSEIGKYMCEVAFEFDKRPMSQIWKMMELSKAKKKLASLQEKLSEEEMQLYIQFDKEIESLQRFIVNKRE